MVVAVMDPAEVFGVTPGMIERRLWEHPGLSLVERGESLGLSVLVGRRDGLAMEVTRDRGWDFRGALTGAAGVYPEDCFGYPVKVAPLGELLTWFAEWSGQDVDVFARLVEG